MFLAAKTIASLVNNCRKSVIELTSCQFHMVTAGSDKTRKLKRLKAETETAETTEMAEKW